MNKKVLVVTYYWPPAGGPGVQRWLKFVTYLRDFEIEPIVYIPENPNYPLTDTSLSDDVPEDIEIISRPIFEPYGLASIFSKKKTKRISSGIIQDKKQSWLEKLMLYIRGNFFIPDARRFWIMPSVKFLSGFIKQHNIDTVITTGPPHSVHLIGLRLKQKTGVKWVADFRDPWTTIGYHDKLRLTKRSKEKHRQLEHMVLNNANQIVVTSFKTADEFKLITTQPITVITNGYEFLNQAPAADALDEKFTISHIGSLLTGRNPKILWEVLSELTKENKDFGESLQIKLAGAVSEDVLEGIAGFGLSSKLHLLGYVPHKEALHLQRNSQLLLLIEIDAEETRGIIPGKLFEYMATKRPIIALGPADADIKRIILDTGTGKFFGYQDKTVLKSTILSYFELFKQGSLQIDPVRLEQYSRKELTKKLAALL